MGYLNSFITKMQDSKEALDAEIKKEANALAQEEAATESIAVADFKETTTPLVLRLKKLIESMPQSEQSTPRPLEFYRSRLRGTDYRYPQKSAHCGQVAAALRELGFKRFRDWKTFDNAYPTVWVPPKIHSFK